MLDSAVSPNKANYIENGISAAATQKEIFSEKTFEKKEAGKKYDKKSYGYKKALYLSLFLIFIALLCFLFLVFPAKPISTAEEQEKELLLLDALALEASSKYSEAEPGRWGEILDGVATGFRTDKKEIALTFDACGGKNGSGSDKDLIDFLTDNKIKATLFINARWAEYNGELLAKMLESGLFEIENHGLSHRPLSAVPRSVYGINGTGSPKAVVYEVETGALALKRLMGHKPPFFRSGTAYYDEVSLKILKDMGYKAVAFRVNADEGATLKADVIYKHMMGVKGGDIVIAHMNRPQGDTAEGMKKALPELIKQGFTFVTLSEVVLE